MESRIIYLKSNYYIWKVEWLNPTYENGAWVYIGDGDEVNKELAFKCINEHFSDNHLYISSTRNDSKEVSTGNIELELGDILGREHFFLWDTAFSKVIEFNSTNGVIRLGKVKSTI